MRFRCRREGCPSDFNETRSEKNMGYCSWACRTIDRRFDWAVDRLSKDPHPRDKEDLIRMIQLLQVVNEAWSEATQIVLTLRKRSRSRRRKASR